MESPAEVSVPGPRLSVRRLQGISGHRGHTDTLVAAVTLVGDRVVE